jgi:hypothetical protein
VSIEICNAPSVAIINILGVDDLLCSLDATVVFARKLVNLLTVLHGTVILCLYGIPNSVKKPIFDSTTLNQ